MIMEIISILLGVFLLGVYGYGYEDGWAPAFTALIDFPSFIIILVLIVPVLLRSGVWQDFKRAWKLLKKDYSCHLRSASYLSISISPLRTRHMTQPGADQH